MDIEQVAQKHGIQAIEQASESKHLSTKRAYTSPQVIVYGILSSLTQGSGGQYGDECTSGHHDEDERY